MRIETSAPLVQLLERRDHRQAADELGDHPELEQVFGLALAKHVAEAALAGGGHHRRPEAHALHSDALLDQLLEAAEGTAADEQDVRGVDLQEFLLGVLAPALGRDVRGRAFDDLQQRLLHALARHVAGDRRVLALARDLVDLVDVHDAALRALDVVVRRLQQVQDDVLDVLADVAGLGERRGVGDREGYVEDLREGLRQQRLAAPGRSEQQDVRLLEFHVADEALALDAAIVVVDGDREDLLGALLTDHVVVEDLLDVVGLRNLRGRGRNFFAPVLLGDDVVAELDALVADVDRGAGDELLDFALALAAERTREIRVVVPLLHPRWPPDIDRAGRSSGAAADRPDIT